VLSNRGSQAQIRHGNKPFQLGKTLSNNQNSLFFVLSLKLADKPRIGAFPLADRGVPITLGDKKTVIRADHSTVINCNT